MYEMALFMAGFTQNAWYENRSSIFPELSTASA